MKRSTVLARTGNLKRKSPMSTRSKVKQVSDKRRQTKTPLRKAAAGQECTLRIPGVCSYDPDRVVGCHLRLFGAAGMGQKPEDIHIVDACDCCHAVLDNRAKWAEADVGFDDVLRALMETQRRRMAAGLIIVPEKAA